MQGIYQQSLTGNKGQLGPFDPSIISYDSYKIDIESADPSKDISMREIYGLE